MEEYSVYVKWFLVASIVAYWSSYFQENSWTIIGISTEGFILSYKFILALSFMGFIQLSLLTGCKKLMAKLNYMLNGKSIYWLLHLSLDQKLHVFISQ